MTYSTYTDVYRKAGIDNTVISEADAEAHIVLADAEIDAMYQKSFGNAQSVTEWIDIEKIDEDDDIDTIFLDKRPVQAITTLESYDVTDTLAITWTSSDYWLDTGMGRIRLKSKHFSQQNHRVKCVYTYGFSSTPSNITALSATIAAMRVLIQQVGGLYDEVTSYSLPSGVTVGVGEPYVSSMRTIDKLDKEKTNLIKAIGQLRTSALVI